VRFHAKHVSVVESGGEYFQASFDNEDPSDDDLDLSPPDQSYLLVQRQLEDDDGGVCYIETLDHDTYTGHYRLRLIELTPTRLAFEIARCGRRTHRVYCCSKEHGCKHQLRVRMREKARQSRCCMQVRGE